MIGVDPQDRQLVMTTKEAGRFLRLSHRTLEDWRLTGQGPPFRKWGRLVRYHVGDLKAFAGGPSFTNTGEALAA
ncbi:helix-turn-helix domain-containing protein [Brevundimonas sp.]|uniref:helix-turn-helix domain-containing protein n=1 Tax=Brevundimonas sp. TaxID=1871086 RepID=UPI0035207F89